MTAYRARCGYCTDDHPPLSSHSTDSQFRVEDDDETVWYPASKCYISGNGKKCSGDACVSTSGNDCSSGKGTISRPRILCLRFYCRNWLASCDVASWRVTYTGSQSTSMSRPPPPSPPPTTIPRIRFPSPPPLGQWYPTIKVEHSSPSQGRSGGRLIGLAVGFTVAGLAALIAIIRRLCNKSNEPEPDRVVYVGQAVEMQPTHPAPAYAVSGADGPPQHSQTIYPPMSSLPAQPASQSPMDVSNSVTGIPVHAPSSHSTGAKVPEVGHV